MTFDPAIGFGFDAFDWSFIAGLLFPWMLGVVGVALLFAVLWIVVLNKKG